MVDAFSLWLSGVEGLIQIGQQILDGFDTNGETDHLGFDASLGLLFDRQLTVSGGGGMAGQ